MSDTGNPFSTETAPDWGGSLCCLRREGTPDRVHLIELLIDEGRRFD